MIEKIGNWVRTDASALITDATSDGFNLTLGGSNWGFGTTSAWRVIKDGDLVAANSDIDRARAALDVVRGVALVDVIPQSALMHGDPVLVLSNDVFLEVFSDTQIDPWTFTTPEMVYVGTPGDCRYNR